MKVNDWVLITQIATREALRNDRSGRRQSRSKKDPKFTIRVTRDRVEVRRPSNGRAGAGSGPLLAVIVDHWI